MTFIQKTFLTLSAALIPLAAAAAAPANITQVEAHIDNGALSVSWAAPNGDIDFYRIYVSHESILDHEGNYDDTVRTPGSETTYTFATLPLTSEKIYIAILAVNKEGVESEGFESEASVDMPAAPAVSEPEPAPEEPTAIPMTVSEVMSASETGVLIVFTKPIAENMVMEPRFFAIVDGSGAGLEITAVEIAGQTILLHTAVQVSEKNYSLSILEPVPANDGTNLPVQAETSSFLGFKSEERPMQEQSSSAAPEEVEYVSNPETPPVEEDLGPPEDPVHLALKAMRRADGTYTVVASWGASPDSKNILSAYILSTTKNGEPFGETMVLAKNQKVTKYDGITPGIFGVKVASKDEKGNESVGIQKVITLPESGVGLLGIVTISGFIAGRRLKRRKNMLD